MSSNIYVQQLMLLDINDHLNALHLISKMVYLKDPQIIKFIKTILKKLISIISHYHESDPVISINACAGLVNIINYSIKMCPEIEKRLKAFINSELDLINFTISISLIKFLIYNLQSMKQNTKSKVQLSKDDEQGFKNTSRVIHLIFKIMTKAFIVENAKQKNEEFKVKFHEQIFIFLELLLDLLKSDDTTFLMEGIQIFLIEVFIFYKKKIIF